MAKPRLLAVATVPPSPVTNGYALRVYHLLVELAAGWEITLVAPAETGPGAVKGLNHVCDYVPVTPSPEWPGMPSRFDAHALRETVRRVTADWPPAAVLAWHGAEFLAFDPEFPPTVADRIDCLTLGKWRDLIHPVAWRERLQTIRATWEFARYERQVVRALPWTVVVGEDDAAVLRRLSGRDTVRVVPNGVVLPSSRDDTDEADVPTVMFSGVLDYCPNIHAARYFSEEVWPAVHAAIPEAKFVIAGRRPVASVLRLATLPGVELVADVPDLRLLIQSAWVAVAPMRCGSGIKNKVLEAWAAAKPVVMTGCATGGLHLEGDAADLVADDPARLAELVIGLLRDHETRRRLGAAAYQVAAKWHTWAGAADQMSTLLDAARGAWPRQGVERRASVRVRIPQRPQSSPLLSDRAGPGSPALLP